MLTFRARSAKCICSALIVYLFIACLELHINKAIMMIPITIFIRVHNGFIFYRLATIFTNSHSTSPSLTSVHSTLHRKCK